VAGCALDATPSLCSPFSSSRVIEGMLLGRFAVSSLKGREDKTDRRTIHESV
jgi:hypothetical protein